MINDVRKLDFVAIHRHLKPLPVRSLILVATLFGDFNNNLANATTTTIQEPAPPPLGTVGGQAPATSGSTEIEGQGTFASAGEKPKEEESTDASELTLSAGGMLSTGNARNASMTGMVDYRFRRKIYQLQAVAVGNYGLTSEENKSNFKEETVKNIQGRIRYDIFFHPRWSAFAMLTTRHDTFQELDFRLNVDPGVAFFALTKANHRLWFEAGYDFQYDVRSRTALYDDVLLEDSLGQPILDEMGNEVTTEVRNAVDKRQNNHAARLFGGYVNKLSENLSFNTGLEYLQSLQKSKIFRLNWENALTVQFRKNLSVAATFILRYENNPLPDVEKLDTQTALNLVYKLP